MPSSTFYIEMVSVSYGSVYVLSQPNVEQKSFDSMDRRTVDVHYGFSCEWSKCIYQQKTFDIARIGMDEASCGLIDCVILKNVLLSISLSIWGIARARFSYHHEFSIHYCFRFVRYVR